ncbi:hypothetical protein PpBr36_00526 [Pyricularia pennisetigena]|uniref:hypothetical protein n=1 Tax=Pyricularia pennisetigena TaxID=1578925 RepID=UPI00114EABC0|nr:hypothetical protein PpBr36_00526 [Pyricularia pennisetigena]TLS29079.1 hypothetical protein PpBr36_00526 [Pyricularia pennisetigena]
MASVPLKRTTETARATGSTASEGYHVAQVHVHASLQGATVAGRHVCIKSLPRPKVKAILVYGDDAAVAKYWKVFAQAELGDADLVEEARAAGAIEGLCQGGQDSIVVLGIAAKLSNSLRHQHIEPVQALGLVAFNSVVCLVEDRAYGQGRWAGSEYAGFLPIEHGLLLLLAARPLV